MCDLFYELLTFLTFFSNFLSQLKSLNSSEQVKMAIVFVRLPAP